MFRAEPSFTSRHATEFTGVDVELAWIDSVEDVMSFEERMLAHVLAAVAAAHGPAIEEQFKTEVTVPPVPFPRLTHAEALAIGRTGAADSGRADLDPAGERAVSAADPGRDRARVRVRDASTPPPFGRSTTCARTGSRS